MNIQSYFITLLVGAGVAILFIMGVYIYFLRLDNENMRETLMQYELASEAYEAQLASAHEKYEKAKNKPPRIVTKTIIKEASNECEDIKSQLRSIRSFDLNSL